MPVNCGTPVDWVQQGKVENPCDGCNCLDSYTIEITPGTNHSVRNFTLSDDGVVEFKGWAKWDGCMNYQWGDDGVMLHSCTGHDLLVQAYLLDQIRIKVATQIYEAKPWPTR